MDNILTRRSIRKFTDKKVSDEMIEKVLKAAMAAPSAANQQPWHFIVVRDSDKLKAIAEVHPYAPMTAHAAGAIIVCGDENCCKFKDFWVQDCSAATQNVLLALHSLGLGGVWCGVYPSKERVDSFRKVLNIPDGVFPLSHIPFGYPGEEKSPSERYDESKVHMNEW